MSAFIKEAKDVLVRFVRFVGSHTSKLAKDVRFKFREWSELGKHRDLINELGKHVYALSREGIALPAETASELDQLKALDQNLELLRESHAADVAAFAAKKAANKAEQAEKRAAAKAAAAEKKAAAKAAAMESAAASAKDELPATDTPEQAVPEAPGQAPAMSMPEEAHVVAADASDAPTLEV